MTYKDDLLALATRAVLDAVEASGPAGATPRDVCEKGLATGMDPLSLGVLVRALVRRGVLRVKHGSLFLSETASVDWRG